MERGAMGDWLLIVCVFLTEASREDGQKPRCWQPAPLRLIFPHHIIKLPETSGKNSLFANHPRNQTVNPEIYAQSFRGRSSWHLSALKKALAKSQFTYFTYALKVHTSLLMGSTYFKAVVPNLGAQSSQWEQIYFEVGLGDKTINIIIEI